MILVGQAVLSLRLVWSNTAFQDEGLYLWAGHLEIAHWLHGTPVPAFAAYFSGSPVLYPPIAAVADSIGGLAAARLLSLAFMLAATCFLWATVSHLFGRRAAFFSSSLFATLGVTVRLGAFATYDALSLCLVAVAAWCAVRAGPCRKSLGWLAGAAMALALANAAKYASALFDPVVVGLLVATRLHVLPGKHALGRGVTMAGCTLGILLALFSFGGGEYTTGALQTTLARIGSGASTSTVLSQSWHLTAVVVVAAAAGVVGAFAGRTAWPERLLICLVALAVVLVPIQQARIHTTTSLSKHLDFGVWFAAIAAGYAIDRLIRLAQPRSLRWAATTALVALLAAPARTGMTQSAALFRSWPNSAALEATLAHLLPATRGPILAEHPSLPEYYFPAEGRAWYRWSSTVSIRLTSGHSLSAQIGTHIADSNYVNRIKTGYFSVVILDFEVTPPLDQRILAALYANLHYNLVASVPYGPRGAQVWEYSPQQHFPKETLGPHARSAPFLEELLTPVARPKPILGSVFLSISAAGLLTIALTVWMRWGWRRNKESDEP